MEPLTIIIPVYNASDYFEKCVASILRHTRLDNDTRLAVIDDCSSDPAIAGILSRLPDCFSRVIHNDRNIGYTKSINRAIRLSPGRDIVLLNSDTAVTAGWLDKLRRAAYSDGRIGTVTPVSNSAGVFSVPESGGTSLPENISLEIMASIVEDCGRGKNFQVPTGNGFCMYIKKSLLERAGLFDAENFPVGYGEENDFCMRALDAGFINIVTLDTFVWHRSHASFGEKNIRLQERGLERLQAFYPDYLMLTDIFLTDETFNAFKADVKEALARLAPRSAGRVNFDGSAVCSQIAPHLLLARKIFSLCATTFREHGVVYLAKKIIKNIFLVAKERNLRGSVECKYSQFTEAGNINLLGYPVGEAGCAEEDAGFDAPGLPCNMEKIAGMLENAEGTICLLDHNFGGGAFCYSSSLIKSYLQNNNAVIHLSWNIERQCIFMVIYRGRQKLFYKIKNLDEVFSCDFIRIDEIILNELVSWNMENFTEPFYNISKICQVITRIGDYARKNGIRLSIPVHDYFCVCPSYTLLNDNNQFCSFGCAHGNSHFCSRLFSQNPGFSIDEWRGSWRGVLEIAQKITCFSTASQKIINGIYPDLAAKTILRPHAPLHVWNRPYRLPVKENMAIGIIGNMSAPKGLEIVKELAWMLEDSETMVVIGHSPRFRAPGNTIFHGKYRQEQLPELLEKYGITVALVPSVWPETFNYVTQECMMLGLPLVSFNIGAQAERVAAWEHGMIAPEMTAESAYATLKKLDSARLAGRAPVDDMNK